MSLNQPTYEESLIKIASLEKQVNVLIAAKGGMDENDKEMEASFKKAMDEMNDDDKKHQAMENDNKEVKDAFKKAMDETDDDKKHEAMKKAMEMKDDNDKKHEAKSAMEKDPKEHPTTNVYHEAAITATIMKKIPIMSKILEATKLIDPANLAKVEKELTAATLKEVEAKYAALQPYIAAVGLNSTQTSSVGMPAMVPFQASTVTQNEPEGIFEAGVDDIDFSKVKTSDIMGLYQ